MRLKFVLGCLGSAVVLLPVVARAGSFTTIADSTTAIPNGSGDFTGFSPGPAIDNLGNVAFSASGSGGQGGVYVKTPIDPCAPLVDTSNKFPSGAGHLVSTPNDPHFNFDNAVFFANTSGGGTGIYTSLHGNLGVVATTSTLVPNADKSTFTTFGDTPAISGNTVAFAGCSASAGGIYLNNSSGFSVVADNSTPIPGGTGNFNFISDDPADPCISGSNVDFVGSGSGGQQGVYLLHAGSLGRVADTNTAVPGGSGNFINFWSYPGISGTNVVFDAEGTSSQQGYYAAINGGALTKIADTNTPIPGGTGDFLFNATPANPCIDGSNVLILEHGSGGQEGIYFWSAGVLSKVVDLTDSIEGKTLEGLDIGRVSLSGDNVVFSATFTDGSSGVFETAVPEPGVVGVVGGSVVLALRRRRSV
jgi:hypothetical protein